MYTITKLKQNCSGQELSSNDLKSMSFKLCTVKPGGRNIMIVVIDDYKTVFGGNNANKKGI